jgi:hypothetical protein
MTFLSRQLSPGSAGKRIIDSMVIIEIEIRLIVLVVKAFAGPFMLVTIQVCEIWRKSRGSLEAANRSLCSS